MPDDTTPEPPAAEPARPRRPLRDGPAPAPPEDPGPPPFFIADHPLMVGGAETMPVRAFSPGDHVPPEHVETHHWQHLVHAPDQWASAPPATPTPEE